MKIRRTVAILLFLIMATASLFACDKTSENNSQNQNISEFSILDSTEISDEISLNDSSSTNFSENESKEVIEEDSEEEEEEEEDSQSIESQTEESSFGESFETDSTYIESEIIESSIAESTETESSEESSIPIEDESSEDISNVESSEIIESSEVESSEYTEESSEMESIPDESSEIESKPSESAPAESEIESSDAVSEENSTEESSETSVESSEEVSEETSVVVESSEVESSEYIEESSETETSEPVESIPEVSEPVEEDPFAKYHVQINTMSEEEAEALIEECILMYINKYRVEEGKCEMTMLNGKSRAYARGRSVQLTTNFAHDTKDERTLATELEYGIYVPEKPETKYDRETGTIIYTGNIIPAYYQPYGGEAISEVIALSHSYVYSIAESSAAGIFKSKAHWEYIGHKDNDCIAIGVTLSGGHACICYLSMDADDAALYD